MGVQGVGAAFVGLDFGFGAFQGDVPEFALVVVADDGGGAVDGDDVDLGCGAVGEFDVV